MSLTQIKEPSVIAKLKAQASMSADAEQILNYIRAIEKANTRLQDDVRGARTEGRKKGLQEAIAICHAHKTTNIMTARMIAMEIEKARDGEPVHNPPAKPAGSSV